MNTTDLKIGAMALLLLAATACGSGGNPSSDYREICQTQRDCLGEETFQSQFDSVVACTNAIEATVTSKSGSCRQATRAVVACRADNLRCDQGVPSVGSRCESEISTREQQCGGSGNPDIASTEDFQEFCNLTKDCVGEMAFQEAYNDVDECVGTFENAIGFLGENCTELYSEAILCNIENFQCVDDEPQMSQQCESDYEEFNDQCGMMN